MLAKKKDATIEFEPLLQSSTDAELLQQLVLKNGQGLTGWVARNRRPLVNGRPSADFIAAGSVLQTTLESATP